MERNDLFYLSKGERHLKTLEEAKCVHLQKKPFICTVTNKYYNNNSKIREFLQEATTVQVSDEVQSVSVFIVTEIINNFERKYRKK